MHPEKSESRAIQRLAAAARGIAIFAAMSGLSLAMAGSASAGEVEIQIVGLDGGKPGDLRVALFDSEASFLDRAKMRSGHRVRADSIPAGEDAVISFHNLPPGRYAISAFHDENGNEQNDKNMVGIPKEGYGFSNDARGRMGPPSFGDAAFEVGKGASRIKIELRYP